MKRLPNWPALLADLLNTSMGKPFAWGRHDCAVLAADCVLAIAGEDPLADLRGRWSTELGAQRVMRRMGGLVQAVTERLGPATSALHARRGDIVLFPGAVTRGAWPGCLGVSFGDRCGAPGAARMDFRPIGDATLCWRVGAT